MLVDDSLDLVARILLEARIDFLVRAAALNDHEENACLLRVGERLLEVAHRGQRHVAAVDGDDAVMLVEAGALRRRVGIHALDDDPAVRQLDDLKAEIAPSGKHLSNLALALLRGGAAALLLFAECSSASSE